MPPENTTEKFNQNGDDLSCVTGVTSIMGISFSLQDRRIDITKEFGHVVEEYKTEYKKNAQLRPWHISKTTQTQLIMFQVNHQIWNMTKFITIYGEVLLLT